MSQTWNPSNLSHLRPRLRPHPAPIQTDGDAGTGTVANRPRPKTLVSCEQCQQSQRCAVDSRAREADSAGISEDSLTNAARMGVEGVRRPKPVCPSGVARTHLPIPPAPCAPIFPSLAVPHASPRSFCSFCSFVALILLIPASFPHATAYLLPICCLLVGHCAHFP